MADHKHLEYSEKFVQMDKEAFYTLISCAIITVLFWLSIYIFGDDLQHFIFFMPLWFVVSCIGGYILSIVTVVILVKYFFKNFNLDK